MANRDELRVLRSLAIGLVEAMACGEAVQLTPAVVDVLIEWLETPSAQRDETVRALLDRANSGRL